MRSIIPFSILAASTLASALTSGPSLLDSLPPASGPLALPRPPFPEIRLIQIDDHDTRWATEDQKLELKRQKVAFMDITDAEDLGMINANKFSTAADGVRKVVFPEKPVFKKEVVPLLKKLEKGNMQANLEKFTSFYTRYYKSDYGRQSSEWLLNRINETADGLESLQLAPFPHSWPQSSIIARIPGHSAKTVVIGAHQDSINLFLPSLLGAPGADDDGSGTVTILEAFRVLTSYFKSTGTKPKQTIEFHWYSAEEGGLLGSQAIFKSYEREGRDVVAMLQQDMTGFVKKTLEAGKPEAVGVITDYVDAGLTEFIKKVITEYCDIPYVLTECGYACSDHASASKAGYPSAFVIESEFKDSDDHIHTTEDKIEHLSFDHMLQHAKLTLGLAYELGMSEEFGDKQLSETMVKGNEL